MQPAAAWNELRDARPLAARLALLTCLPVRVAPALVRLARQRLLPRAATGDEADLWLSDLVEARSAAGFSYRRAARAFLRERLREEDGLLDELWRRVHLEHAPWLAPRARLEEELTWRLLRDRADDAIESLWTGVVRELDEGGNAEGVARWVIRAVPDLPEGTLDHAAGRRAWYGSHLLLGDASVLGDEAQEFLESGGFAFATRRLPRRRIQVGTAGGGLLVSPVQPIENGHEIDVPATRPLWLQLEHDNTQPFMVEVLRLDQAPLHQPFVVPPFTLRALDGAAWRLDAARATDHDADETRAPKVVIEVEVEVGNELQKKQWPLVIGVLADLSGRPTQPLASVADRRFIDVDADNLDDVMKRIGPRLAFMVPDMLAPGGGGELRVELTFESMADFSPDAVAGKVDALGPLLAQRRRLRSTIAPIPEDAVAKIEASVAAIDRKLSDQLRPIFDHEDFRRLEGTWRGLHYLVGNARTGDDLKIRVLNLSKADLAQALKGSQASDWDQAPLYRKVYEEVYGVFGGEPFGCLVGDYVFDHTHADVGLLAELGRLARTALAPFIAGAAPAILGLESWKDFAFLTSFPDVEGPNHSAWRSLRDLEESRYIALTAPRVLARSPYGLPGARAAEFDFEEGISQDHGWGELQPPNLTWFNAAYALAANLARAFSAHGWCAGIQGVQTGGAVVGLPSREVLAGGADMPAGSGIEASTVEASIVDLGAAQLAEIGLLPLTQRGPLSYPTFESSRSLKKVDNYDEPDAALEAELATRLSYLLPATRFVHYLKCLVRDKIGSFAGPEIVQRWLNHWIMDYVNDDPDNSSPRVSASRPLASAEVIVEDDPDDPGQYACEIYLTPWYQLEDAPRVTLRLATQLPSSRQA